MDTVDTPELSATLAEVLARPPGTGEFSAPVLRHGTMELRMFRPGESDMQTPHDRDELYIVAAGSAVLLRGTRHSPWEEPSLIGDAAERIPLRTGDTAIVPAGTPHHFVEYSPGFATWMVFWGAEGGEVP